MVMIKPSKIYISSANVDMRKAIDGLSWIVQGKFKLDPMSVQCLCFTTITAIKSRFCTGMAMAFVCCISE
ncbi:MAG TPA: transposase [Clostridiales bacterium]|nr:transposase [Clostridiales bacterium]